MLVRPWIRRFTPLVLLALASAGCSESDRMAGPDPGPQPGPDRDLAWLRANAVPFATAEPGRDLSDLMPLKEIVGDARIVALGEATHGTREFFTMKHRVLEFLVREMGFDLFAIEATWAEARRVNDYVHTGLGDPAVLLSNLYFWTWNTAEVLDMIRWMRDHNLAAGAPGISFFGFDMQFSRLAMDDVWDYAVEHLVAVDPEITALIGTGYTCWRTWERAPNYRNLPAERKMECRDGVRAVHDHLERRRAEYEQASSTEAYEWALRAARIVVQHEYLASRDWIGVEPNPRDRYMAENADWLLATARPDSRIVLWAHNAHVMDVDPWMGAFLRREHGDDLVVIGFSFADGTFNAVPFRIGGASGPLTAFTARPAVPSSYDHTFKQLGEPRFLVDVRPLRGSTSQAEAWLHGPHPLRSVGCCYDETRPEQYYMSTRLTRDYDVIIHFEETQPSLLLPFVGTPPDGTPPHPSTRPPDGI